MNEQSKAQRLASLLREKPDSDGHCLAAAAELERLEKLAWDQHTEIFGLRAKIRNLEATKKRLTDDRIWREYMQLWPFHPADEPALAKDILRFARSIEAAVLEES